jgi:hypothetical protein
VRLRSEKVLEAHLKVDSAVKTRLRKAENFMLKARTFETKKDRIES